VPIHQLGVLGDGSDQYYLPDGGHPNVAGYELIAAMWYETMTGSP
jgi:lysophospholipase L1-like esterase